MKLVNKVRAFVALVLVLASIGTFGVFEAHAAVCVESGENCQVGERGPMGGVIFYDAGSQQWWGRYLEAEIGSTVSTGPWGGASSIYGSSNVQALQRRSMGIGMGRENTALMRAAGSPLANDMFPAGSDWYLPSKDELDLLYNYRVLNLARPDTMWNSLPMWSSSESSAGFAWYQLFQDGTQFTDDQGIRPGVKSNKSYVTSPEHVGSEFKPLLMNVIKIRSFPTPGSPPPAALVTSVRENADCSTSAMNCRIGDKGPAGGIVVYDAGSDQSWGRYLEVAPQSCEIEKVAFNPSNAKPSLYATQQDRVKAKAIGMGRTNTTLLASNFDGAARVADNSTCNNYGDWFLPSKDELNEAFRQLSHSRTGLQPTPVGGFDRGYYWTSTDYNGSTAWTQYFADGQQFDRVQTLSANKQPPARPFRVRPMRAFKTGQVSTGSIPPPEKQVTKTITITCGRTTVSGKPGIECNGITEGFTSGETFVPYLKFPGQTEYTPVSARPEVDAKGNIYWSRKTGKKAYVYFTSSDGTVVSNRMIIPQA